MNRTMLKSKIHRATARLVLHGDTIIVISYGSYDPEDLEQYDPRVVHVTQDNEIRTIDNEVATPLGAPTA
jgi:aspartate 1-decarboxylase